MPILKRKLIKDDYNIFIINIYGNILSHDFSSFENIFQELFKETVKYGIIFELGTIDNISPDFLLKLSQSIISYMNNTRENIIATSVVTNSTILIALIKNLFKIKKLSRPNCITQSLDESIEFIDDNAHILMKY